MSNLLEVFEWNERFATTTRNGGIRMWTVNIEGEPVEVGIKKENNND